MESLQTHIPFAPNQPPPPPYTPTWQAEGNGKVASVRFDSGGELHHIRDNTGQNRRVWEGWASLEGIDWEDEDYPASVFTEAMKTYTMKNPVVLWDHIRSMPIGQITEWDVVEKNGLFVRGYLYDQRDFPYGGQILDKCNEVWPLVQSGKIRGLSWVGVARKRWVYSEELRRQIKQATEVLIHEITVTPTQVNPGAKITGVNTVAKAISVCKALSVGDIQMDKIEQVKAAQAEYLKALHGLDDGMELPTDLVSNQVAIDKAMGLESASKALPDNNPPTNTDTNTDANTPALRNKVQHGTGAGSNPKPGSTGKDFYEVSAKALKIGGHIRGGKLNDGKGDDLRVNGPDLMGLWMSRNGIRLNWPEYKGRPDISHGEGVLKLLSLAEQQQ